jgi:fluoride exporter
VTVLLVVGAGACGALLRYLVERTVHLRLGPGFPFGTLLINVSGSFVLGFVVSVAAHHHLPASVVTVVGTGLLGAYTTFSTFSFDTVSLLERGRPRASASNVGLTLVAGLGAAAAGLALGSVL